MYNDHLVSIYIYILAPQARKLLNAEWNAKKSLVSSRAAARRYWFLNQGYVLADYIVYVRKRQTL